MTATEAAVGFALARAGVLPEWLCLQEGVGTTRTAVKSRRLVLGAAVEVGVSTWEVLRRRLPLFLILLNLAVAFKGGTGTVVVGPTWLSEARVSDGRHYRYYWQWRRRTESQRL